MDPLSPAERRALRARAHALHPIVSVGHHGLTPAVLHEIDLALLAHELVKIRIVSGDRDARDTMHAQICEALDAAPVQHIGKLLIVFRPAPPPEPETRPRSTKKSSAKTRAARRRPTQTRSSRPPAARARRRPR
jgi:putative YhbY family RNA-binding protein